MLLKHYDEPVLQYKVLQNSANPEIQVTRVFKPELLPINTRKDQFLSWLIDRSRVGRHFFSEDLLKAHKIDLTKPLEILKVTKGLSLNDVYWICSEYSKSTFTKVNLYDRGYSETVAKASLTGEYNAIAEDGEDRADLSTKGMLPKAWIKEDGHINLYKSGNIISNDARGMQPYSEFFASQAADLLGINHVSYTLSARYDVLCSVCSIFTSKSVSYVTMSQLVRTGNIGAYDFIAAMGEKYIDGFEDMIIFDYLINNTDRHSENYGFLADNKTNALTAFAPVFDNGEGLFGRVLDGALEVMAKKLNLYDSISFNTAIISRCLKPRHIPGLEKLMDFTFTNDEKHPASPERLRILNELIHTRAESLLKM